MSEIAFGHFDKEKERILALIKRVTCPFDSLSPQEREAKKERCRASVLEFMKTYMPHYVPGEFSNYHKKLENYTKVENEPVFMAGPKETGKSVILTIGDYTRRACYAINWFMIIGSQTEDQAANRAAFIKFEFEVNPRIKQDFGDLVGDWLWERKDFVLKNGIRIKSRALKQQVAGLLHRQHRPDAFRGEDLEDERSAKNRDRTEDVKTWILDVVLGGMGSCFSLIWAGNIVSKHCALNQLILKQDEKGRKKYKGQVYKLLQDNGQSLCPDIWPVKRIKKRKYQLGLVRFNKVYQNDPLDPQAKFREAWIKDVTQEEEEKIKKDYLIHVYTDPIVKPGPASCTSATVVAGLNITRWKKGVLEIVVFDAAIKKLSTNQMVEYHYLFEEKHKPAVHWFESVAFSAWLQYEFINKAKEKNRLLNIRPYRQIHIHKDIRIETISGPIENAQIRFCRHNGDVNVLIDQLLHYGDRAVPMDGPDALASLYEILRKSGSKMYVFDG